MAADSITVRTKRDIIDFVNSHPKGTRRTQALVFIALGGIFVDAYDFTSLGIGVDALKAQFQLSAFQVGTMTAAMAVGALLGALLGGYLVDRVGRFKLFVLDLILFVVAAIGAGFAPNLGILLVFRFFLGFGVGLDMPASFSFVAEFTNRQSKGKYVNMWQGMWYVAVVATGLVVLPFYFAGAGPNLWRWAVGFGAVPAAIVLLLRLRFTEESPMWAAHRLGLRDAARILEKSYGVDVVVDEAAGQEAVKRLPGFRAIFTSRYRARTALAAIISGTQSMEYFAVGFYIPTIVALLLGQGTLYAILGTIVINLFGVLGGTTQPFVTARLGVRRLAITGYIIVAACLLLLGIVGGSVPGVVAALLVGVLIFGHSFGPGAQGKTMAALSYPTEIRGVGMGFTEGMSRVGTILGFYVFPVILAAAGLAHTMLALIVIPLVGLVALGFIKWEPVGQDVETPESEGTATTAASA
ncbi:MAG TPA: MFS transporter [Streptosporangiales bacterium]